MRTRWRAAAAVAVWILMALTFSACGGSPPTAPPGPGGGNGGGSGGGTGGGGSSNPPTNTPPAIDSIAVQGRRPQQPALFADVRETVDVNATVRDPETSLDELVYQWTATAGTFSGTGRTVTWTAPDAIDKPATVTLTLKVVENYGHPGQPKIYSQETSFSATLALHDSAKEIGAMAVRFLTDFSQTDPNDDWHDIMRDFKESACPVPGEVDAERDDVVRHYTSYQMHGYTIGSPSVALNFGGACSFRAKRGDACVSVPVSWDSTDRTTSVRAPAVGIDHIAAAYSTADSRWWLCSSDFESTTSLRHAFYSGR